MACPTFSGVAAKGLRTAPPLADEGWVLCMASVSQTNKTQTKKIAKKGGTIYVRTSLISLVTSQPS